jgi:hypothetical protein
MVVKATLAVFWAAGYFMVGRSYSETGFGVVRMNLFAVVDPDSWSFVIPDIPRTEREGFNYLGTGLLSLALVASAALVRVRLRAMDRRRAVPLFVALPGRDDASRYESSDGRHKRAVRVRGPCVP